MTPLVIPAPLRRARLLAARLYPYRSIPRRAILGGQWDRSQVVRQFLTSDPEEAERVVAERAAEPERD